MERSSSRLSGRAIGSNTRASQQPSRIKVVARFRPNIEDTTSCIEDITDNTVQISGLNQQFTFDRVFGPETTQECVFDEAVRPTIEGVLAGYNGCVLAYGQTGAGKSHTMMGGHLKEDEGAIPRMVDYLFRHKPDLYTVKVGYIEIYNEKVRDLLSQHYPGDDLKVHEHNGGGGFYVKGLKEIDVYSAEDVYGVMRRGARNRSTAATNMNSTSSRSHSVFLVDVCGPHARSKLVLVDLAGSEKVAKTGARGTLLEEAVNINKSLSSLGMVVNALAAAADRTSSELSSQHIPYRDSKLTRILQDSLGGNSRTCLIVNCSPSSLHISETISTLRFGVRAKHVKTVPRINYTPNDQSAAATAAMEIEQLQQQLLESHREMYKTLKTERSRLISLKSRNIEALAQNKQVITNLEQQLKEAEQRAREDECYLFNDISRLESRVS